MKGVDELMATCPLKHEIRVSLWEKFILKLHKKPIRYLTLYSPPLMDVKFLNDKGLINVIDGVYSGVVGVGLDAQSEADTTSSLTNRLEHLLSGNINNLINGIGEQQKKIKQLDEQFPFDVINLDYTDSLHKYSNKEQISPHIAAIDAILDKQRKKGCTNFVLLLTTNVKKDRYETTFLDYLTTILNENISTTPGFEKKLKDELKVDSAKEFQDKDFNTFFTLTLVKYLLKFLKDHSYDLAAGEVRWLVRDMKSPKRHLLHLAFHIKSYDPGKPGKREHVGKRVNNVEHKSVNFIRKDYPALVETIDRVRLGKIHNSVITKYNESTFEIQVPEIKS